MVAAWEILDRATQTRKRLLAAGFLPLPARGKAIPVDDWTNLKATETDIDAWFNRYPDAPNTGVLTASTPAIDIDVLDPDAADAIELIAREMTGDGYMLVRYGQPPKRAVLYRCDAPFKKITTPIFTSPNGQRQKCEVLADGQQIIFFGKHPDIDRDYSWHGGIPGDITRADLPEMTQAMAREFIDRATEHMRAIGWAEVRKPNGNGADHSAGGGGETFDSIYGEREQKFAQAALQGLARELAAMAPETGRNNQLNKAAFRLGTMIARGWLTRSEVEAQLLAASHANGLIRDTGQGAVEKTIASGIEAGLKTPHDDLEERAEAWRQTGGDNGAALNLICADDVTQQPVSWLWKNRLARGKITLLGGDPGQGKSQILINVIAHITANPMWPDGGAAPHGHCLILSAEDAASDVICPRLSFAGADLTRVQIIKSMRDKDGRQRSFNLQRDLDVLSAAVMQIGDVKLIGIDPLTAYLGDKVDSHRTTDVRAIMERLDAFGEATGIAILAVTHPPKAAQGKAINAFTGSLAFVAASRVAFITVEEAETDRMLLLAVKNNLGAKADGIGYRLEPGMTAQGIETCRVAWDLAPVIVTANEALAEAAAEPKRGQQRREAEEFLTGYLEGGPMPVDKIEAAAKANGIAQRTLRRARQDMDIIVEKSDFAGGWQWRLP